MNPGNPHRSLALVVLAAVLSAPAFATQIYVYKMPGGGRMITDQVRNDSGFRLLKTYRDQNLTPDRPVKTAYRPTSSDYDGLIRDMATSHRVDTALIKAIIHAESAFDRYAVSEKGALGLMQLMPATADRYGVDSAFDPHQNVRGGIRYLKDLLQQFGGDTRLAVAG
ncbi:MAG: transglycosylase SLT domain-containing protein, partial [Gammaproteobacteria bacterium]|nr:transglycosylase SLT domain-containing protein [Gammaproteobacteria bacterium]